MKGRQLQKTVKISYSRNFYEATETPVNYIRLDKPLEDTDQDFLVMSRGLAEAVADADNPVALADAEIRMGDNGLWGLICPDRNPTSEAINLW